MHPDLQKLKDEFEVVRSDAARLMTGITTDQFNWHAVQGQWSICECLSHLNVVNGLDVDELARAVIAARAAGWSSNGAFRYGVISSYFIRKMEPPVKMKFKAPAVYAPPAAQPPEVVVKEFSRIHTRLGEILSMADGLDLARIKVSTPISKWIHFSFTQRMRLLAAHDRRHLWQAWQIPGQRGFPG